MIIQCKNCSRKYVVRDQDVPTKGRTVKCSYCSSTWLQMPSAFKDTAAASNFSIASSKEINENVDDNFPTENIKASDGKTYKFQNSQWTELYPSGKTGLFAKKKITRELNRLTGRKTLKVAKKKNKDVNPSSIISNNSKKLPDIYEPKKGLGFFGYVFLTIVIIFIIIGSLKFFEADLIYYFPQMVQAFEILDKQITYIFETINNVITIFDDLFKSY